MPDTLPTSLQRNKKYIVCLLCILPLICLIVLITSNLINKSWFSLKNDNLLKEVPSSRVNDLKNALDYTLKSLNYPEIKDATIREDSISNTQENLTEGLIGYTTTFLVDIDSIKQTYQLSVSWHNKPSNADDTLSITCPKISDSKFPNSECVTETNDSHLTDLWLPYTTSLESGEKIVTKSINASGGGRTLQIYLFSCEDATPPIEETSSTIQDWVKNTIKDPRADNYRYHVRYGYCDGDPI